MNSYEYAIGDCYLGNVLVISKPNEEICRISLGKNKLELLSELQILQPKNEDYTLYEDDSKNLNKIINLIENPKMILQKSLKDLGIEYSLGGTDFQKLIWKTLIGTLPGTTITYTGLANRILSTLNPKDYSRAVAQACASNKLAVLVPCHRVIRKDGKLSGYKWGVERKKLLLEREKSS